MTPLRTSTIGAYVIRSEPSVRRVAAIATHAPGESAGGDFGAVADFATSSVARVTSFEIRSGAIMFARHSETAFGFLDDPVGRTGGGRLSQIGGDIRSRGRGRLTRRLQMNLGVFGSR